MIFKYRGCSYTHITSHTKSLTTLPIDSNTTPINESLSALLRKLQLTLGRLKSSDNESGVAIVEHQIRQVKDRLKSLGVSTKDRVKTPENFDETFIISEIKRIKSQDADCTAYTTTKRLQALKAKITKASYITQDLNTKLRILDLKVLVNDAIDVYSTQKLNDEVNHIQNEFNSLMNTAK